MPTERKIRQVEEIKDRISNCTIAVATNPTGLGVNDMVDLRKRLRENGIQYRIVKNTLTYIAADSVNKPEIKEIMEGMTGLAFGFGEPADVAKVLQEFIRTTRSVLSIRGAVMDSKVLTAGEVVILATLPPRSELIADLMGKLCTPVTKLVTQLESPIFRLVNTLTNPYKMLSIVLQERINQITTQK